MSNLQDRLDDFRKAFESGAAPYNAPHEAIGKSQLAILRHVNGIQCFDKPLLRHSRT